MANVIEKRLLRKAARYWGIQPDYLNANGEPTGSSSQSIKKVLSVLSGRDVHDVTSLQQVIYQRYSQKITSVMEPVHVQKASQGMRVVAFLPHDIAVDNLHFLLEQEGGKSERCFFESSVSSRIYHLENQYYRRYVFRSSKSPAEGYHHLSLVSNGQVLAKTLLICPPEKRTDHQKKKLGIFTPLYAVRSQRNLGIGDLGDLRNLQTHLHKLGCDFVGTLPLLAQDFGPKFDSISPYSASSKLFWNEAYLDLQEVVKQYPLLQKVYSHRDLNLVEELQKNEDVLYAQVIPLKQKLTLEMSKVFLAEYAEKDKGFQRFKKQKYLLSEYCQFRSHGDPEKQGYHLFAQYQMERQLKDLKSLAGKKGAEIYLDYPVGTSKDGFDNIYFSQEFINVLSVGAPPDVLFRKGQNWGISPIHPLKMRESGYQYLIESLRSHMLLGNIIRLDHVMAFKRLYVIPNDSNAREGVYLRYNPDEMFAVLAIEAQRHGVDIIGENLGTVPESIQRSLKDNGFRGMWVFLFEAGESPTAAVERMPPANLACLNTHDLVPFQGYLESFDIHKFKELGIYTPKKSRKEVHSREEVIKKWSQDLDVEDSEYLFMKVCELMASGPADLFLINLEDLWGETKPQNIPGTWHEFPNWTRKLKFSVEEWSQSSEVNNFINRLAHMRKKWKEHGHASDLRRHLSVQ
ncbi:4-alpha-glucanotransferase [Bdellovibrio sp. SKB1291214]|uniref:4-alpha-glucanotransferase n=1 Tax=Bdellovibrio sp. SKB1291214 TaxID=1732569 RepID=UPI000B51C50A|nr:4-alpha-glucanotransferase [Bdellovibrio sp. SKB1291214]UYL09625.1 4-alpha-glucanotransferase [Bdellovibrio sp. SKB1291214]